MKKKYVINPDTLALEREQHGFKYWLQRSGWYLFGGVCIGLIFFFLFFSIFPSPKEKQLQQENHNLTAQMEMLSRQMDEMQVVLQDLSERDDNLYRVILGAEPVPLSVRQGATHKMAYYDNIAQMTNSQLAADLTQKIDLLEKELYVQAKSYEQVLDLTKSKEIRLENIPAIQPVLNKDLTRVASGYGWRVHPVYHTKKFHQGMDFTAPTGTEIFATGNATVASVGWRQGYGNSVLLDHGFGYETLYAHCFKCLVRPGQKVKRGDVIALVGNTGMSTGPHLHYEVHLNKKVVDPRNYYFIDLSPEEYDKMVQLSNNFGQALD